MTLSYFEYWYLRDDRLTLARSVPAATAWEFSKEFSKALADTIHTERDSCAIEMTKPYLPPDKLKLVLDGAMTCAVKELAGDVIKVLTLYGVEMDFDEMLLAMLYRSAEDGKCDDVSALIDACIDCGAEVDFGRLLSGALVNCHWSVANMVWERRDVVTRSNLVECAKTIMEAHDLSKDGHSREYLYSQHLLLMMDRLCATWKINLFEELSAWWVVYSQ